MTWRKLRSIALGTLVVGGYVLLSIWGADSTDCIQQAPSGDYVCRSR